MPVRFKGPAEISQTRTEEEPQHIPVLVWGVEGSPGVGTRPRAWVVRKVWEPVQSEIRLILGFSLGGVEGYRGGVYPF